jgi:predicted nucleic acid-binding protein
VIGYVVDASVAAKWCLPPRGETLVEESLRLLGEFTAGRVRLFVPDLFWPELGNIFWKAVRRERLSRESAAEAIHTMSELPIPTLPTLPLLRDAFTIAARFQCTVYDSTYAALAVASDRLLVTADERLANSLAPHLPVRWLGSVG